MSMTRRLVSLARLQISLAALGSIIAATSGASAEELSLKAAVFVPPTTTFGLPFKRFVDHVNETGKGILQIRIVGGPEAVPADGQAQAVRTGVLDIASIPPTYYKSLVVEGDAQILTDMSLAEQRRSGAYAALNKIVTERMASFYLTTYGVGVPLHLYLTKDMPLSKAEDLAGLRFRGQPSYNAIFKQYGIASVNIAPTEVYTALERGIVQGYGWPLWGIGDLGWDKLTKIRIDPGFYNSIVDILMNKPKYDSLASAQRKVLDDAVAWFEADNLRYTNDTSRAALDAQRKLGIKVVDFGPGFKKMAVDLSWADLKKLSPNSVAKLQAVFAK